MMYLAHHLISQAAVRCPDAEALRYQEQSLSYGELQQQTAQFAQALLHLGIDRSDRVAVYLEKRLENVLAMFGASAAGAVFVPVNPLLKAEQLLYILNDCQVKVLVTSSERFAAISEFLPQCLALQTIVITGSARPNNTGDIHLVYWDELMHWQARTDQYKPAHPCIDADIAAILYTSGSTGKPKGVVLSHRNLLTGAHSVVQYLQNTASDRILCVLPLSFDYGLSQLTTAFLAGASAVLLNYLFPRDIVDAVVRENITGLAAVPPLWMQLVQLDWSAAHSLRYLTNSGGVMQVVTLNVLRQKLPDARVFLMYGLTEAFRSTYLPPEQLENRPDSIGKAIPNAEVLVLRPDGSECDVDEPGELVHRGALVALGYWNDAEKTAERFRPLPRRDGLALAEMAVWSGDTVRRDAQGYLYFIGRFDDMIKVSGYRISPSEVEEVIFALEGVSELAVVGVPHPTLGQALVAIVQQNAGNSLTETAVRKHCQRQLPAYMVPSHIQISHADLPRNPNGKIDRKLLQHSFAAMFLTEGQDR